MVVLNTFNPKLRCQLRYRCIYVCCEKLPIIRV